MRNLINVLNIISIAVGIIFSFNSCYVTTTTGIPIERQKENIYYVPSTPVSTTLLEKNEINFNLLRSSSSKFTGLEVQGAYLPSNHIGIIAGFNHASNKDPIETYMKFNRFELGAGYLASLPNNCHFETHVGGGFGKATNYHATGLSKTNLGIFFIQPAVGFYNKPKTVSFDIVSKFSGVKFNVMDTSFQTNDEPFSALQLKKLNDKPFNLMWEPALIFRAGWQNILFHVSYTSSLNLTNSDLNQSKGNIALGISFHFNPKKGVKY